MSDEYLRRNMDVIALEVRDRLDALEKNYNDMDINVGAFIKYNKYEIAELRERIEYGFPKLQVYCENIIKQQIASLEYKVKLLEVKINDE